MVEKAAAKSRSKSKSKIQRKKSKSKKNKSTIGSNKLAFSNINLKKKSTSNLRSSKLKSTIKKLTQKQ